MWPFRKPSFVRFNMTLLQVGVVHDPQPEVQQEDKCCDDGSFSDTSPAVIGFVSA